MVKFIVISGCVCVSVYRADSKRGRLILDAGDIIPWEGAQAQ